MFFFKVGSKKKNKVGSSKIKARVCFEDSEV